MSKPQKNVGRVSTRQTTSAYGDVGLREEAANPTYGGWREVTLQDAFEINPRREIKRGTVTPFVPMDALPEHSREIARIDAREFTGSGTRFKNGDTLLARITPCLENGKTAYVSGLEDDTVAHGSTEYIVIAEKQNVSNGLFAYYLARSPEFRTYAIGHMEGTSGRQRVPSGAVAKFHFNLPPLPEQKAIAHILGTLDDKIELNRRMNATLEAMARALFQSWFVDFDPVRAKLDGRQPAGLDAATAALFPAHFQDSPLGHIPKGWEVKPFGEVIELAYGKPLKAEDRKNGSICVYGANGPVGWHDEKLVSGPGIVVGRKGNPGVVTWAHGDFYPIDTTFYVVPTGDCRSLYFYYYALSVHNLANLSADSAVPGLNRNHAYMSKQVIPRQPVLEAFNSQISPIFAAIHANEQQSRTLATLRDTLLPKLLSGELSVMQAEGVATNVLPFPEHTSDKTARKTTDEFIEAVVIAQLVRKLATAQYPLGRKRYNKLAYLAHRKAEDDVTQHYLKKAAGPYNPWAKYGGPEKIARQNGYVKQAKSGTFEGLVVGDNIDKIDSYAPNYPVCAAIDWVIGKCRFKKNDDLELLATVDFAALDLLRNGQGVTTETIKEVIAANKEWAPKLNRTVFSDKNIDRALAELAGLFPATYAT